MSNIVRRKASSFEEYWLASKAWERRGLTLGTARALVNAGFVTVEDLQTAQDLELASIPRVGPKSLAILYRLMERKMPAAPSRRRVRRPLRASFEKAGRLRGTQLMSGRSRRYSIQIKDANGASLLLIKASWTEKERRGLSRAHPRWLPFHPAQIAKVSLPTITANCAAHGVE